jgi:20S proteasome alpha/beta subunit
MTIAIGLKCSDGVVMEADGAATLGDVGLRTIVQPTTKLSIIDDRIIFGFSGPVGLSQLLYDRACTACRGIQNRGLPAACRLLRDEFLKDATTAFQTAALARNVVGGIASENIVHHTLLALEVESRPQLIQFDYQCHPEWTTDALPFVTIGSGQPIADPFMAFIRQVFWRDRLPSLAEGRLAVYWTLEHAIRTAPGGIGRPIQIATLETNEDKNLLARILSKEELKEHEVAITAVEEHLQNFQSAQRPEADLPPPPSPPPPPHRA